MRTKKLLAFAFFECALLSPLAHADSVAKYICGPYKLYVETKTGHYPLYF